MALNVQAARDLGYSDQEILDYLQSTRGINIDAAREIGYDDASILSYLSEREDFAPSTPAEPATPALDVAPVEEPETTFFGQVGETLKGVPRGFANSFLSAGEGVAELADAATNALGFEDAIDSGDQNALVAASREGRRLVQEYLGADEAYRDEWLTKFGEGVGSFASFFTPTVAVKALGLAGKATKAIEAGNVARAAQLARAERQAQLGLTGTLAAGTGAGDQAQRIQAARDAGIEVTEDQEDKAIFFGGLTGLTELAPVERLLKRIPKDADEFFKQGIVDRLKSALVSGGVEGGQEVFAAVVQDAIERGIYNENLPENESLWEDFTIGGAIGSLADLAVNSAAGRIRTQTTRAQREYEQKLRDDQNETIAFYEQALSRAQQQEAAGRMPAGMAQMLADQEQQQREQDAEVAPDQIAPPAPRQVTPRITTPGRYVTVRVPEVDPETGDRTFKTFQAEERTRTVNGRTFRTVEEPQPDGTFKEWAISVDGNPVPNVEVIESVEAPETIQRTQRKNPMQQYARHVARVLGPRFPVGTKFEVKQNEQGGFGELVNGVPKFTVVDSRGRQYGIGLDSLEDAAVFAGSLNEEVINSEVMNGIDQILDTAPQTYTPEQASTLRLYGFRALHPDQNTYTSAAIDLAAGTTQADGFDQLQKASALLQQGAKPSQLTASQRINAKRLERGLPEVDTFTIEEARSVLGDKFENLVDPDIMGEMETETYSPSRNEAGEFIVVSSAGEVLDGRPPTLRERDQAIKARRRPPKKIRFANKAEAQAYATRLNENRGISQINFFPEGSINSLKRLLRAKNIDNTLNDTEVKQLAELLTGVKLGNKNISSMKPGEIKVLYQKLRSLPRFNVPTKLPSFKLKSYTRNQFQNANKLVERGVTDPEAIGRSVGIDTATPEGQRKVNELLGDLRSQGAMEQAKEVEQVAEEGPILALPGPDERMTALRDALKKSMERFGLGDVAANLDYALQNVFRNDRGELVFGVRPRRQQETETSRPFGQEGVFVRDELPARTGAFYSPSVRQIFLAADRLPANATREQQEEYFLSILDHEQLHAMRDLDLFTDREWAVLTKLAQTKKNKDGETYIERAKKDYADRSEVIQIEEAIAELTRDARRDKRLVAGKPRKVMERITDFMVRLKNFLNGAGFQSFEDVISRIESGEIGRRERGQIRTLYRTELETGRPTRRVGPQVAVRGDTAPPPPRGTARVEDFPEELLGDDGREARYSVRPEGEADVRSQRGRDRAGRDQVRGAAPTADQGAGREPLPGAPIREGATGPDPGLNAAAEAYAESVGIPLTRQTEYVKVDPAFARRIAQAFEEMEDAPTDPRVQEAYRDLARQTRNQYDALVDAGYTFTFFDSESDPYDGNPYNAMRDLRNNKRMAVYGTYDGYGAPDDFYADLSDPNRVMLQDSGLRWKDQNGEERVVTNNDLFRAVHDAFGHGLEGAGFRARGEENAWQAHAKLFTGPALQALTTETRGQNSWLNYGPYGEQNRNAGVLETVFADQKMGLMPEWTSQERRDGLEDRFAYTRRRTRETGIVGPDALAEAQISDYKPRLNWSITDQKAFGAIPNVIDFSETPRYQRREKRRDPQIVYMTPEQYIDEAARILYLKDADYRDPDDPTPAQIIRSRRREYERINDIANILADGESFQVPYLNYVTGGQEGFHRAMAAQGLNQETIPVMVVRSTRGEDRVPPPDFLPPVIEEGGGPLTLDRGEGIEDRFALLPMEGEARRLGITNEEIMPTAEEIQQMKDGTYRPQQRRNLIEAARYLHQRWMEATGRTDPFEYNEETLNLLADAMAEESIAALENDANAIGWYDSKIKAAKAVMRLVDPRITENPESEAAFDFVLAVSSNGQAVADNFKYAAQLFDFYKKNGRLPSNKKEFSQGGERNEAMLEAFNFFNAYNESGTNVPLREFLDQDFTVKELTAFAKAFNERVGFDAIKVPSAEGVNVSVKGSYILGPKIGQGFYQNIRGNYDPLTMDIWWMRMWNRLVGRPFQAPRDLSKSRDELRKLLSKVGGLPRKLISEVAEGQDQPLGTILQDDDLTDQFIQDLERRYQKYYKDFKARYKRNHVKPEIFKKTGTYVKNMGDQLQAIPKNATEREFMRRVVTEAKRRLAKRGIDITTADLQALLWYPEKQLYRALGVAPGRGSDNDYLDAAIMLAEEKGVSRGKIEKALRDADRGRAVDGEPSAAREDGAVRRDAQRVGRAEEIREARLPQEEGLAELRYREPAKVERTVKENEEAAVQRGDGFPRYSYLADPEAQYVARNPDQAAVVSDQLLDRYARSNTPELSQEEQDVIGRNVAPAPEGVTPGQTYMDVTGESKLSYILTKFKQQAINRFARLEKLNQDPRLKNHLADTSSIAAALMADRAKGILASAIKYGVPVYRNGITKVEKFVHNGKEYRGLIDVMAPLYNNQYGQSLEEIAQAYAIARRAERLKARGIKAPTQAGDLQKIQQIVNRYVNEETGRPIVEEWFDAWQAYNAKTVEFLKNTGMLDEQTADVWANASDYIPFYRQAEGEELGGVPGVFSGLTSASEFDRIKGSERAVNVPMLEAITRNLSVAIEMGMKNVAQQRIVRDMITLGMAREIPVSQPNGNYMAVTFKVNGKKRKFIIDDPLIYESMQPLADGEMTQMLNRFLGAPSKLLRETVTRDPGFMIANMLRDTLSSWVTSGSSFVPVIDTVRGFADGMETLEQYGVVGGYDFSNDPDDVVKFFGKQAARRGQKFAGQKDTSFVLKPFMKIWDALGNATTMSDAATRKAVYDDVLARTGNEAEAAFQALEVINFGRRGSSALARVLTTAIPFLNARFQGLDVFYRAYTGQYSANSELNRRQKVQSAITRSTLLMGLTGLYYMLVSDDEEYRNQNDEVRDNNFIIPTGTGVPVKIPIPFEVGILFKTIPERVLDASVGDTSSREMRESIQRALVSTFEINPLGIQAIAPIVEASMNHNFYTGRQIVPYYMDQGMAAELQTRSSTSQIANFIGSEMNISPLKVDHIMYGYLGTLGGYALDTVDMILRSPALTGEKEAVLPARRVYEYPVMKRFFGSEYASGAKEDFYQMNREILRLVTSLNQLKEQGDAEKYEAYLQSKGHLLGLRDSSNYIANELSKLRQQRTMVERSDMTAEQKRDMIDQIEEATAALLGPVPELKRYARLPAFEGRFAERLTGQ